MNPTPNQITECDDEKRLCEWAAIYCLGLRLRQHPYDSSISAFFNHEDLYTPVITQEDYQPTSPTEKGKAQCFDLMMKYKLTVDVENESIMGPGWAGDCVSIHGPVTQKGMVKAALLCAIGE